MSKRIAAATALLLLPAAALLSSLAFWRRRPESEGADPSGAMDPEDYQGVLEAVGTYCALRNCRASLIDGEVLVDGPGVSSHRPLHELIAACRGLSREQWPAAVGRFFAPAAAAGPAWPRLDTERPLTEAQAPAVPAAPSPVSPAAPPPAPSRDYEALAAGAAPSRIRYHPSRGSDTPTAEGESPAGAALSSGTATASGEPATPAAGMVPPPPATISAIEAVMGHPFELDEGPAPSGLPSRIADYAGRVLKRLAPKRARAKKSPLARSKGRGARGPKASAQSKGEAAAVPVAPSHDPLAGLSLADARELLAVQLFAADSLSAAEREASIYSEDLPGLLSAAVCRMPEGAVRVSPRMVDAWDVDAQDLFMAAIFSLRRLRPDAQQVTFAPGLDGKRYESAERFAAAQALLLGEDPLARGPFGALVALPRPELLLVCPLQPVPGAAVAVGDALVGLVEHVIGSERQGHPPLSRKLYWYHDDAFTELPYEVRMEGGRPAVDLYPPAEFLQMLEELARS
ncbi:MAG TPA: hypothetical protein PLG21_06755 [Anaerolineae bacterium]|nr:hypothetical protein [Anaerolineae bacterium]